MNRRDFILALAPVATAPAALADSGTAWPTAQASGLGWPQAVMQGLLDDCEKLQPLRSLAVASRGRLVAQHYFHGADATGLQSVNSATKGVCSLLVGRALARGRLKDLSQTVGELLPQEATQYPRSRVNALTLRQILTGTSGMAYDIPNQMLAFMGARDPLAFAFALEPQSGPLSWSYNDAVVSLLSPILEHAYGAPLAEVARQELFAPLSIDAFEWQKDRAGRAMAYAGLRMKTTDFLKIAHLAAAGGTWNGNQVVSREWLAQCTARQIGGAWPVAPVEDSGYGFLWFTGRMQGRDVAWAWGYGGQFALAVPALELAVVTTATSPQFNLLNSQTASVMSIVSRLVEIAASAKT
ncbi:MAG: serine hydrolase domain-containing protein [Pseudomonadota bacterium]